VLLQATLCLCNIASNGDECCSELYKHNVLVGVIPILQLSDAEIVHMALCLVEMILQTCPDASFLSTVFVVISLIHISSLSMIYCYNVYCYLTNWQLSFCKKGEISMTFFLQVKCF